MINRNRLARIERILKKNKIDDVIIRFTDGTELRVELQDIQKALIGESVEWLKSVEGKDIVDCSKYGKLIHIVQQLSEDEDIQ